MDAGTAALTLLALVAFAANSLLTRLALGAGAIDAATFTAVRIASGAVSLAVVARLIRRDVPGGGQRSGGWSGAAPLVLIIYAVPFSFAYVRIGAAVGALVLFGAVQLTMVAYGIARGERPGRLAWVGLLLATSGLALLAQPSSASPDPIGLALMALAGAAWGAYSIAGRHATDPVASNARSFAWSVAPAAALAAILYRSAILTPRGLLIAVVSGAVTSGLGYIVWYAAVRRLEVTQAAVAQLTVPVLAGLGGVAILGERLTSRLLVAGAAVLGGIALVLASRSRDVRSPLAPPPSSRA